MPRRTRSKPPSKSATRGKGPPPEKEATASTGSTVATGSNSQSIRPGSPSAALDPGGMSVAIPGDSSGDEIFELALKHCGETYILGARAPMTNAEWSGPWDCAEFASWCVYQATEVLYGVRPRLDPIRADAFTGYWAEQAREDNATVSLEEAVRARGACLLRAPRSHRCGHIAISDGNGGTVEAHCASTGVIQQRASGRRWDFGVLVPGVRYFLGDEPIEIAQPVTILQLADPMMRGQRVRQVQEALASRGLDVGAIDGIYGPQTESAVQIFQERHGLVADGEVGDLTWRALGFE